MTTQSALLEGRDVSPISQLSLDLTSDAVPDRCEEVGQVGQEALSHLASEGGYSIPPTITPTPDDTKKVNEIASRFLKQNLAAEILIFTRLKEDKTSLDIQQISQQVQELHATMDALNHLKQELTKLTYDTGKTEYKLSESLYQQCKDLKAKGIVLIDDLQPQKKISAKELSNICDTIEKNVKSLESKKYDIITVKVPVLAKLMQLITEVAKGVVDRQKHFNDLLTRNQRD